MFKSSSAWVIFSPNSASLGDPMMMIASIYSPYPCWWCVQTDSQVCFKHLGDARVGWICARLEGPSGELFVQGDVALADLRDQVVRRLRRFAVAAIAALGIPQAQEFLVKVLRLL